MNVTELKALADKLTATEVDQLVILRIDQEMEDLEARLDALADRKAALATAMKGSDESAPAQKKPQRTQRPQNKKPPAKKTDTTRKEKAAAGDGLKAAIVRVLADEQGALKATEIAARLAETDFGWDPSNTKPEMLRKRIGVLLCDKKLFANQGRGMGYALVEA